MFRFERGLRPRNPFLGEASEGAAEAPSDGTLQMDPYPLPLGAEKGPAARRRPRAAREAYSLYVERAAEGANEADGPLSAPAGRREGSSGEAGTPGPTRAVLPVPST